MSIEDIKNKVSPVLRKYPITEAYLFGSTARQENRPDSDVDILVKFSKLGGLFEFVHIKLELEEALGGRRVDLVQMEAVRPKMKPYIDKDKISIL